MISVTEWRIIRWLGGGLREYLIITQKNEIVNKIRATATRKKGSEVGMKRYQIIKEAIGHIKKSIENEYYLESITLCESLIADRLESRLKYLTNSDKFSFKPLGELIKGIINKESDQKLKDYCNQELNSWKNKRNEALHAMAKIEDGSMKSWQQKIDDCKDAAIEGETLRKKIFAVTDKLKT